MPTIRVEVFGQIHSITTDADPTYLVELARYVDEKMEKIAQETKATVSTNKIAVLAAIQIANELHSLKEEISENNQQVNLKIENITKSLSIQPAEEE